MKVRSGRKVRFWGRKSDSVWKVRFWEKKVRFCEESQIWEENQILVKKVRL